MMDVLDDHVGHIEEDIVVDTTIDLRLQTAAEKALIEELAQSAATRPAPARARCSP